MVAVLATAQTFTLDGISARPVRVEVDVHRGLPSFAIVGLPDTAVREARERVRAALANCGFEFPLRRIVANLAPASLRKAGPGMDLAIAAALLIASDQLDWPRASKLALVGELALDGSVRALPGVLAIAEAARVSGAEAIVVPVGNGAEAALVDGLDVVPLESLGQLASLASGEWAPSRPEPLPLALGPGDGSPDLEDLRGQRHLRYALEVAAAGGHSLLMIGPPGAGKSMLAARLPTILPPLTPAELLDVSMIASVAGEIEGGALTNKRPFRSPHHSASMPALVGGGLRARPGEISLAHNGVLFLDEMPEFSAQVLDSLRQPLETGDVAIARVNHRITYPARFMLVAAMNPCRCGRANDPGFSCKRGPNTRCVAEYQSRLSGPLLDRIDLHIEVPAVTAADLILPPPAEGSREVAARVARARDIQLERYAALGLENVRTNAQAHGPVLEQVARADGSGLALLRDAADSMHLSARGYHRVLRVARTLADLDGAEKVGRVHFAEALSYRALADEVRRAA